VKALGELVSDDCIRDLISSMSLCDFGFWGLIWLAVFLCCCVNASLNIARVDECIALYRAYLLVGLALMIW